MIGIIIQTGYRILLLIAFLFARSESKGGEYYQVRSYMYTPINVDTIFSNYYAYISEQFVMCTDMDKAISTMWKNDTIFRFDTDGERLLWVTPLKRVELTDYMLGFYTGYPPIQNESYNIFESSDEHVYSQANGYEFFVLKDTTNNILDSISFRISPNEYYRRFHFLRSGILYSQELTSSRLSDTIIHPFDISDFQLPPPSKRKQDSVIGSDEAIEVNLRDVKGLRFTDINGISSTTTIDSNFTMIHFWFVGCGACASVHQILNNYVNTVGVEVYSLARNSGHKIEKVRKYATALNLKGTVGLLELAGSELKKMGIGISGFPHLIIYSRESDKLYEFRGYFEGMEDIVDEILRDEYED